MPLGAGGSHQPERGDFWGPALAWGTGKQGAGATLSHQPTSALGTAKGQKRAYGGPRAAFPQPLLSMNISAACRAPYHFNGGIRNFAESISLTWASYLSLTKLSGQEEEYLWDGPFF